VGHICILYPLGIWASCTHQWKMYQRLSLSLHWAILSVW
jgi:hypothetical protein